MILAEWIFATAALVAYAVLVVFDTELAQTLGPPFAVIAIAIWLHLNLRGRTHGPLR